MINKRIISHRFPMKISTKSSISFSEQNPTISRTHGWFWIGSYYLWMKLICLEFETIYFEMRSLFFCLIKRTKNQGRGMVVKAQSSVFIKISLRGALFCLLLNSLILSVIFCEASVKSLAFQFANKTQQSQGQSIIINWKLWFMNDRN